MNLQKLTKAEEDLMKMFWKHGAMTVSEMIEKMSPPQPTHSSVSSIVRILEKKEFVDHEPAGRSYRYFPIIAKKDYSKFSLRKLVTNYFEGSVNELVSFLVQEEDLSLKELESIKEEIRKKEQS